MNRNAIVLMIDGLGAGSLAPYGNTWLETPAFNRLAAESLLVEFAYSDSDDWERAYNSMFSGWHSLGVKELDPSRRLSIDWVRRSKDNGTHTVLISDDPQVCNGNLSDSFSEVINVEQPSSVDLATEVSDTEFGRLFSAAIDVLATLREPYLLWIHARGFYGKWDAPYDYRAKFAEEEDPEPSRLVDPPRMFLPPDTDPDLLLDFQQAYAGQVTLLDMCLGLFLDELHEQHSAKQSLLTVGATRGFPLGGHGIVGDYEPRLLGDVCQVPLLLRFPNGLGAGRRGRLIAQSADIGVSVADWIYGVAETSARSQWATGELWGRNLADTLSVPYRSPENLMVSANARDQTIRTPSWLMRRDANENVELYTKPDDRWEVNDVARRCRQDVFLLEEALNNFVSAASQNDRRMLVELNSELFNQQT